MKAAEKQRRNRLRKPRFEQAGITTCELGLDGCWHDNALGYAHSKKFMDRRTEEDEEEVILACNPCHDIIEKMKRKLMLFIVKGVIALRKIQPKSINEKL